jgi:protein ImuB
MGSDRVGAPATVDSHRPGAFEMAAFELGRSVAPASAWSQARSQSLNSQSLNPQSVLRRFRQPVPARVAIESGRPVRVTTDRRGSGEGRVVSSAGPWRSSGHWWNTEKIACGHAEPGVWDHEEWDVALADGGVYRLFQDCTDGGWFLEAIAD